MRLGHPYLLLTLCVSFWAGNFVLGRAVRADFPPIALAFWRWTAAALIILPFVWRPLRAQWPLIARRRWRMLLLALLSVAGFNTFVYLGLQTTTATNSVLLQSSMPIFILMLNWVIYRQRAHAFELASVVLALSGVGLILGRGDPLRLLGGDWNPGDLWVLCAVLMWAMYSVFLRWRPRELDPRAFLGFTVLVGAAVLLPFYLGESLLGRQVRFNGQALAVVAYVAIFPSALSYLFWNRGVAEVGANTAGHFIHLLPVVGSLLAVVFLGESLRWYHLAGAALVAAAIVLSLVAHRRSG